MIRLFIFFSSYPFGGIFTHQKMKNNWPNKNFPLINIHSQPNMRVPKKFKDILLLWYALLCTMQIPQQPSVPLALAPPPLNPQGLLNDCGKSPQELLGSKIMQQYSWNSCWFGHCENCYQRAVFQRSAFGRSTAGNDVVATIFIILFFFRCVSTSRFHKFCLSVCVFVCVSPVLINRSRRLFSPLYSSI